MNNKQQFEAWYLENWGCTEDNHDSLFEESPHGGEYYRFGVRLAWQAWQAASKASEQQLLELSVKLANVESERAELAAESEKQQTHSEALAVDNAALREVVERMVNQFAMSGISPEEKSINPAKSLMFDAKSALFMPATDAYLAEVRAQGVEMYADKTEREANGYGMDSHDWRRMMKVRADAIEFAAQLRQGVEHE